MRDDGWVPWPRRRDALPAEVTQDLRLQEGERVLATSREEAGDWHVATDQALHVAVDGRHQRIAWECVDRASWDRDSERLVVVEVADFGEPHPEHRLDLTEPGLLLEVVRERVTASVLLSRHVSVAGSRGLKVVARRAPTGGGDVIWSFWLDVGLQPDDPSVRAAVERGLAEAQSELGM